jgi:hypothetical protein
MGAEQTPHGPLPANTDEFGPILIPESVLKTRTILKGPMQVPQVLIKWQDLDVSLATWEDKEEIIRTFPNFNLEDKVDANGGSIVRNEDGRLANDEVMIANDGPCHVAASPQNVEVRRGMRVRKPNPKYY